MQILTFHLAASKSFLHWNEGHDNNLSTGLFLTIIICSRERAEAPATGGRGSLPAHRVACRCQGQRLKLFPWGTRGKMQAEAARPGACGKETGIYSALSPGLRPE